MALLTDSDFLTQSDLAAVDPEIPEVAAAELITVEGPQSIVRTAWEECANALTEKMQLFGAGNLTGVSTFGSPRPRLLLTQIVASDRYAGKLSLLQRWMLYYALGVFYRAAGARTVNDRYPLKRETWEAEARKHWKSLVTSGLPIVHEALPCPGAVHEYNSGTWALSIVAGGAGSGGTFEVAITYADIARYVGPTNKRNAESGPGSRLALNVPASNLLRVSIAGLVPPSAATLYGGTPASGSFPALTATHWNVYAGAPSGTLYLQNASPIPVGTTEYTFAGDPVLTGYPLETGQVPDANFQFTTFMQRI